MKLTVVASWVANMLLKERKEAEMKESKDQRGKNISLTDPIRLAW